METEKFYYNLSEKIEYSKKGDFTSTASLEFDAPTMNVYDEVSDLSQLVMSAMMDSRRFATGSTSESAGVDSSAEIDAKAVKMILLSSKEVKFKDVASVFKKIAYKTGTTDGDVKITDVIISKLSNNDFTGLVCEYVANFIIPSLL